MSTAFWIAWAISAVGCEDPRVRQEAAAALTCPEAEIRLEQGQNGRWMANGCERTAACTAAAGAPIACGLLKPTDATSAEARTAIVPARASSTGADTRSIGAGWLDRDVIQQVIKAHNFQVQGCYERELTNAPKLAGHLTVRFTISPSGGVTSSEVVQSHGPNAALEQCVTSQLRSWAFPRPTGGMVRASYRFVFKQADAPAQVRTQRAPIQL